MVNIWVLIGKAFSELLVYHFPNLLDAMHVIVGHFFVSFEVLWKFVVFGKFCFDQIKLFHNNLLLGLSLFKRFLIRRYLLSCLLWVLVVFNFLVVLDLCFKILNFEVQDGASGPKKDQLRRKFVDIIEISRIGNDLIRQRVKNKEVGKFRLLSSDQFW